VTCQSTNERNSRDDKRLQLTRAKTGTQRDDSGEQLNGHGRRTSVEEPKMDYDARGTCVVVVGAAFDASDAR
jgi:hypothetical protein